MTNKKNKEQILFSLGNILDSFEESTKRYLDGIDTNTTFVFSDNEELRKSYLSSYKKFSINLKIHIEKCEKEIASLAALICKSDNTDDKELTESLVKYFDKYTAFSESVSLFIKKCDTVFLNKEISFSPIVITNYARELLVATQAFKKSK